MEKRGFSISDHDVAARLARLSAFQAAALESALAALENASRSNPQGGEGLPFFLLPMAESGLTGEQMAVLAAKVPDGFPLDHREIYFDFRLGRWMRHIEPPTLSGCLEEYLESAASPAEGIAYLKAQWLEFLRRHAAD